MITDQQEFQLFRRRRIQSKAAAAHVPIVFQIGFDEYGAYIEVVDRKGRPVEVSYQNYSGAARNVLSLMENIREREGFVIDWEKQKDKVYLSEHPYLIESLMHCEGMVWHEGRELHFAGGSNQAILRLLIIESERPDYLRSQFVVRFGPDLIQEFRFLTEQHVLAGDAIVETFPAGANFGHISLFNTEFSKRDLVFFLSLVFSNVERLEVAYEDFDTRIQTDEPIHAQPCLVFEGIDENNSLSVRIAQSLPDISFEALEQFNLYRYAEVNEIARQIRVRYIEQPPLETLVQEVLKALRKHEEKRSKSGREEVLVDGALLVIPSEIANKFIYQELPSLLATFTIMGAEKLKTYKINTHTPNLDMRLSHSIDYFEGDVSLQFGAEKISLFDAISQFNKKRYVLLSDGSHALLNEDYVRRLERLFTQKGKKTRLSFFDLPLIDDLISDTASQKVFTRSRAIFEGFNDLAKKRVKKPAVEAVLRPYQEQGYRWLKYLHEHGLGGCLADDMGLGKTLQTIALLADIYPGVEKPTLIVMPRSLIFNWERELSRFAPQLKYYTFYGQGRDYEGMNEAYLTLTTYATMRNEIERLKDIEFHYVILDESQQIKNIHTQTSKAALLLQSKHRLALSGTPIENNLGELFALFNFLNPAMFGSLARFSNDYLTPIQKNNDKGAANQLRKKIYPFILRRLKRDVLKDLPDKIEQTLFVPMGEAQAKLYEQKRRYFAEMINQQISEKGLQGAQFYVFQAMNELRQIASIPEALTDGRVESAKLELLMEQLSDVVANGHKALVFVNFIAAVEGISEKLADQGIGHVTMTGATRDRETLVNRFQNDPDCRVFVMTLKTGGVGLNLTAADTVFIYDPWWNVAAENQAIDRAHRIGQLSKVLAYKLIAQGSIEEKILKLQELKKELFDNIISADGSALKSLTEEDINLLLGK